MFNFSTVFGKESKPDEHATSPGAEASPSNQSGVSAHAVSAAAQNAEAQLANSPRKRGRPRKDDATSGNTERALQDQVNTALIAQLDALHDPALWGALLSAPADTARFLTGREHWGLAKEERALLGSAGSAAARVMMITNPRALAFALAGAAICSVYLPRAGKELAIYMEERRKKEKETEKKPDEPKSS